MESVSGAQRLRVRMHRGGRFVEIVTATYTECKTAGARDKETDKVTERGRQTYGGCDYDYVR